MPSYTVWYRDNAEPLEFVTAYRPTEMQILEHILAHEDISAPDASAAPALSAAEVIASHRLAPVRYTEDESEINTIG